MTRDGGMAINITIKMTVSPLSASQVADEAPPTDQERAEWASWDEEVPCEEEGGADAIGHAGAEVSCCQQGAGRRVQGTGYRVQGTGFRV